MSKKASKKEDTISQLKKEENKTKKDLKKEEEESASEEENEEQNQDDIKEQTVQRTDKPKSLRDLLNSMDDTKTKQKPKKEITKQKQKNNDEPKKLTFFNSKGAGNASKIDEEIKERKLKEKKVFKNAKGLDEVAKENQKIKPTKNYTEKEIQKEYNEDVEKPQFITNKDKDENFVELDKNEDLFAKNLANKKYEDVREYADNNKEGGERKKREYKKRYYPKKSRKEAPKNQEEIKDDVDSDGFEIVGSKEEKKQKFRDEHRGEYAPRRGRGKWRKK